MGGIEQKIIAVWDNYKNNHKISLCSPFIFLIEQQIFVKIHETGKISELEKSFLIDYMKMGIMGEEEILDYEDLRKKNPSLDLPELDF